MVNQLSIRFFLRKDQPSEKGNIPVYVRVILGREKFEFSTKHYVETLKDWDDQTQRFKKRHPINEVLSEIEMKVREGYQYLKYSGKPLTALALRNHLKGDKNVRVRLLDYVDEHYRERVLPNQEYADATKKSYLSTINHLKAFLHYRKKNSIKLAEVEICFIKDFDLYLQNRSIIDKKALNKNSANKYHVNFKAMLYHAINQNLLEKNPYREFKIKSEPGRLTYLTDAELERLEKHKLGGNRSLLRVRDIFIFSVYTGLRFSDAIHLKAEHIVYEKGSIWISYTQQKTSNPNRIPMLKKALAIYHKYEAERKVTGFVLPQISNQKQNAYLKVIADMVGITKSLTHHVARHTAATTIFLQNGIPLEETGKFLGHRTIKTTQIYAKVTNMMLRNAANKLNKLL